MSELTRLADVADQVKKYWSPIGISKLKEDSYLPSLVNREYEGTIQNEGDRVIVSEYVIPKATRKQTGAGEEAFDSVKLQTQKVEVIANQTITVAYEVQSLLEIESQIKQADSKLRENMIMGLENELNAYLMSLVNPSASAPDHLINGVADFNATELAKVRNLAAKARWMKDGNWFGLVDPSYYSDMLNSATLTSRDFTEGDTIINGKIANKRMGFNIMEDNSDALLSLSPALAGADVGLFFHKDFMHLVMPQDIQFQISSLHSQKKHGYLISAHIVCGAALGIDGAKKHIKVYNT